MKSEHEVISAFLDDEPFDPRELAAALSEPGGRTLMLDLIELGRIVQPDNIAATSRNRHMWRPIALAAALVLALGGGYVVGERRAALATSEAPPAARVVEAVAFTPEGGMR